MQFDVIIGNPPYQQKGRNGSCDPPIYHLFIEQAQKLKPRFLSMVVPSRWRACGRALDEFRKNMLRSGKLIRLVDFPIPTEVFPDVDVAGGICYFLWSESYKGLCEITVARGNDISTSSRRLDEFDVFVRCPKSIGILRKVLNAGERPVTDILTASTPFGIVTNFADFHEKREMGDLMIYYVRSGKRGTGYVSRSLINKNEKLIDKWKVLVPKASSVGGQKSPCCVLGKPWIAPPQSVATQTFLVFFTFSEEQARSIESYYRTKFFRHLVSLRKLTQNADRPVYSWVPVQQWDQQWTDEALYKKYGLTQEEIDHVEAVIRPM